MALGRQYYARSPEVLVVGLARRGDRLAFDELVRRRQGWIRNLMRRCSGNEALADDLAQQAFLQAWQSLPRLRQPSRFGAWLKRLAINAWLQHARKNDPLAQPEAADAAPARADSRPAIGMDLDRALQALPADMRICIVLGYHEGLSHEEVADFVGLPLGTVKSHIRRGSLRLQELLSAYTDKSAPGDIP